MPEFGRVDVQSIYSEVNRSTLSESDIEQLADAILANGGLLQPLILKQTSVESFLVLEGHFEFYSAVRAREKNPRQGEMVNAFVLSPSEEATTLEQIKLLRKQVKPPDPDLTTLIANVETRLSKKLEDVQLLIQPVSPPNLTALIDNVETRLSKKLEDVLQNQQGIDLRLKELEEKSIKPIPTSIITDPSELRKLTVPDLKKLAKDRGKTGVSKMNKEALVKLLSQP